LLFNRRLTWARRSSSTSTPLSRSLVCMTKR
jgi:hypothetical protein